MIPTRDTTIAVGVGLVLILLLGFSVLSYQNTVHLAERQTGLAKAHEQLAAIERLADLADRVVAANPQTDTTSDLWPPASQPVVEETRELDDWIEMICRREVHRNHHRTRHGTMLASHRHLPSPARRAAGAGPTALMARRYAPGRRER